MPLHLLGKKSWNVYNADNVARVRRDEAEAEARETAEEQRMQEEDSARRLAVLRGEEPPPLEAPPTRDSDDKTANSSRPRHGDRRPRKRAGEDDTDFEMRMAMERAAQGERVTRELAGPGTVSGSIAKRHNAPIVDRAGNISLFGEVDERAARHAEKNDEAEREAAKKRRELEDQYQMRFTNAAGRDGAGLTDGGPWYAKGGDGGPGKAAQETPSLNAFGRADPGRKSRDVARLDMSDPLAMMKQGAAKVRSLEKTRRSEMEERERDLRALKKEEKTARRREKERRREHRARSERSRSPERHSSRSYRHRDGGRDRGRDKDRDRDRLERSSRDDKRHRSDRSEDTRRGHDGSSHHRDRKH